MFEKKKKYIYIYTFFYYYYIYKYIYIYIIKKFSQPAGSEYVLLLLMGSAMGMPILSYKNNKRCLTLVDGLGHGDADPLI